MNFLESFPEKEDLLQFYKHLQVKPVHKVNGHIHTPFSYSSFDNIEQAIALAVNENIKILGINDFFVTDGYAPFCKNAIENKIFPLFNIEFIGLIKQAQANNIRINDPVNPGRIYLTGKGLKYPFSLDNSLKSALDEVIKESQLQVKAMIDKANEWFQQVGIGIMLDYHQIKKNYAKELVRERHIAKAVRIAIFEKYTDERQRISVFEKLFEGKPLKSKLADTLAIENEIRGNLLKADGKAFVKEDERSFLEIDILIKIITNAGGIPCYPVLLDDNKGNFTEFEANFQNLHDNLLNYKISCIEIISNRNDFDILKKFVKFFNDNGFVVLFGTEHNTPDLIPLTPVARYNKPLDTELLAISFENACVICAHQYLIAKGKEGFISSKGHAKIFEKDAFSELGKAVIEWYLK